MTGITYPKVLPYGNLSHALRDSICEREFLAVLALDGLITDAT